MGILMVGFLAGLGLWVYGVVGEWLDRRREEREERDRQWEMQREVERIWRDYAKRMKDIEEGRY